MSVQRINSRRAKGVQRKPEYIKPETDGTHVVKIPYVATSGAPSSPCGYNNALHAALHALLAAMQCDKKEDVLAWLEDGSRQLSDAVKALKKPRAKVVPAPAVV